MFYPSINIRAITPESNIQAGYPTIQLKKFILTAIDKFKFVYTDESNTRKVDEYNLSGLRQDLFNRMNFPEYSTEGYINVSNKSSVRIGHFTSVGEGIPLAVDIICVGEGDFRSIGVHGDKQSTFPKYWVAQGESETDEPATSTINLFEEPLWLFQDIMFRRLSQVTKRFINGLDIQYVQLRSKSRQLASPPGDTVSHQRYDHTVNWGRLMIAHCWEAINNLSDVKEEDLPLARRLVEGYVKKVEEQIPHSETAEEFFIDHHQGQWYTVHQNRHIRYANPDGTPGDLIRNINAEYTNDEGVLNAPAAEAEFKRCTTTCFARSWGDKRRQLRSTIQVSYGWGDTEVTFPKSQLTDESTLG